MSHGLCLSSESTMETLVIKCCLDINFFKKNTKLKHSGKPTQLGTGMCCCYIIFYVYRLQWHHISKILQKIKWFQCLWITFLLHPTFLWIDLLYSRQLRNMRLKLNLQFGFIYYLVFLVDQWLCHHILSLINPIQDSWNRQGWSWRSSFVGRK